MTAVYGHCSNIIEICKSYKGGSSFSRIDLAPAAKEGGGYSVWLGQIGCCSSKPGIRSTGNKYSKSFLGSASISWWNSFHPKQVHTLPVQHTAGCVLGPVGALPRCLSRHRSYLDHTIFEETPGPGRF